MEELAERPPHQEQQVGTCQCSSTFSAITCVIFATDHWIYLVTCPRQESERMGTTEGVDKDVNKMATVIIAVYHRFKIHIIAKYSPFFPPSLPASLPPSLPSFHFFFSLVLFSGFL